MRRDHHSACPPVDQNATRSTRGLDDVDAHADPSNWNGVTVRA